MNRRADAKVSLPGWLKRVMMRRGRGGVTARARQLSGIAACLVIACLALLVPLAAPASGEPPRALVLRWENDVLSSTDANYTAGFSMNYTRNDSGILGWIWGEYGANHGRPYSSYELAQLLFTPSDLDRVPPDPRDRPYAGLLYAGITTGLQTESSLNALKLLVGVVGPSSLGEVGQETTHYLLGHTLPDGWDYQLKDEPLLNLIYEYRHRYRLAGSDNGLAAELIPIGTAMVGNYLTKARVEAQLRLGYRLSDDFGETSIRGLGALPLPENGAVPGDPGMYVYMGGGGDMVAHDITLDGNSFSSGPGVDKKTFVSSGIVGLAYRSERFLGSFSYIFRGREFEGQDGGEKYGSIAFTYLFR